MFEPKAFFDYCIPEECLEDNNYEKTMKLLYNFGYRTVAINQTLDSSSLSNQKKKKKGDPVEQSQMDFVPEPFEIRSVQGCNDLKIYNRLTVVFADNVFIHRLLKSPRYKKYHIIAALPTSASALAFTCGNFEAEIFTVNPENKFHLKCNRKMYNQLVERGYHLEILYSPAIEDPSKRKNIIHLSHLYRTFAKSRNVIVSSGATNPFLIRNPYDVINLGPIFGLNELQAKSAITHCGRQVFINSTGRRHGKAVMFVENLEDKPKIEKIIENVDSAMNCTAQGDIIELVESDDDVEILEQPASKKIKQ